MYTSAGAGPVSLGLVTVLALLFTCGRGVGEWWQCRGNMTQQCIQTHHSYTHIQPYTHTTHSYTQTHANPRGSTQKVGLLMSCNPSTDGATSLYQGNSLVSIRSTSNPSNSTTHLAIIHILNGSLIGTHSISPVSPHLSLDSYLVQKHTK